MSLLLLMSQTDPNPRTLFASNEPGVVFDAQESLNRGWLWQDTAGQTLAASPGDPIGLQLDTSRGGVDALGSDLVSNGGFDSDTVWTKGANWTIGSGVATKTGGAANNLTQTITSTAGLWYRCTATVTRTAGTLTISLGTSGTSFAVSSSGTYTFFLLAGSSTQTLTFAGDSSFAGTVDAVTAKLVPGTHRYQSVSGSRPVLARIPEGGRRNLLGYTEQLDNSYWSKNNGTISANSTTSPFGELTADTITQSGGTVLAFIERSLSQVTGQVYTLSIYAKKNALRDYLLIEERWSGASQRTYFDIANGTVFSTAATHTAQIQNVGDGWFRCSITSTSTSSSTNSIFIGPSGAGSIIVPADGGSMFLYGAQLETGSSATAYQKVTLTSDVTESGKRDCYGVLYDGSDDSFITASIDMTSTASMTVMSAVRKLSDAAAGALMELSANTNGNTGSFWIFAPGSAGTTVSFAFLSRGTQTVIGTSGINILLASYPAPITAVLCGKANIATDGMELRINGQSAGSSSEDQGSGNYGNYPLYFGRRNNASFPYNGYEFCTIIRGATTADSVIRDFERNYLARRAGISI